jgi:hypothetical protein
LVVRTHSELAILVEPGGGFCDYTIGTPATATQGKEEFLVLAPVGSHIGSIGQDDPHLDSIVDTKTKDRCEDAVASTSDPAAGNADCGARATKGL